MARNSRTVKAAKFGQAKSRSKVIEWETRQYSRGTREVPVEVSTMESQPKPRKKTGRRRKTENNYALQGEAAPQPMDVDDTFWMEEPVVVASEKRVRCPALPSSMSLTYLPERALLY